MIGNLLAADGEAIQGENRILRMELARSKLERLRDPFDHFHAIQTFESIFGNIMRFTDRTDHCLLDSLGEMHRQTSGFDVFDDMFHLLGSGIRLHDDHHLLFSFGLFRQIGA